MSELGALSWRDVYSAVATLESRVMARFDKLEAETSQSVKDHEFRLRTLEDARREADAARAAKKDIVSTSRAFVLTVVAISNGLVGLVVVIANQLTAHK